MPVPNMEDDLLHEYLAESREHLADIEADLLLIEERGADIDTDHVNKVFRAAHSIKGGAGFFDLARMRDLAHTLENVLDLIRSAKLVPTGDVVSALLKGFDRLRAMVDDPAGSASMDIAPLQAALEQTVAAGGSSPQAENMRKHVCVGAGAVQPRVSVTAFDLDSARSSGKLVYLVRCDLIHDVQRKGKTPLTLLHQLIDYGVVLDTAFDLAAAGTLDEESSNEFCLDILYATAVGADLIAQVVEVAQQRIWTVAVDGSLQLVGSADPPPPALAAANPEPPPVAAATPLAAVVPVAPDPPPAAEAKAPGETASRQAAEATVRLPVSLLDSLMNLAGELVLGRNQLNDAVSRQDTQLIVAASQRLSSATSDLQEAVTRTRMQPIGSLFHKFHRQVRDSSQRLGKRIRLITEGNDVELDKKIIEGLSDPLNHMIRNAMDHGIEAPAGRIQCGKPEEGTVWLRAFHEAGEVILEIADDGRGIDCEKVAASAISKGIATIESVARMSEPEKLALILVPSVSTAAKVSELSGRGVGMDVVKTNIERLGGKLEISSELGHGSTFRIQLPLTLAIIPSLLVSVRGEQLAIPQVSVQKLVRIAPAEAPERIGGVGNSQLLMLGGELLPLVDLAQVLDCCGARPSADRALNIVIVAAGSHRYGLLVDSLHTTLEIVVKPLGRHVKHLAHYAGATILGDGRIALILDVAGLAGLVGLEHRAQGKAVAAGADLATDAQQFVLLRHSANQACAVPLGLVARVERIQAAAVETVGGRRSMQYRGGTLPLMTLGDAAGLQPLEIQHGALVVVLRMGGREMGMLGMEPVDVVETDAPIDTRTLRQPGVAGSAIIRGRTTLIVNPFEIADRCWPGWNRSKQTGMREITGRPTVLVVEDSAFMREQVVAIVHAQGCVAIDAEDGLAAWEILRQPDHGISLVLTDVEMPRLDGLTLTKRIRADARLAHIPVLMLTSLGSEDARRRGHEAGATAYSVKLDRDELASTLLRLLGSATRPDTAIQSLAQLSGELLAAGPPVSPVANAAEHSAGISASAPVPVPAELDVVRTTQGDFR
ncbi:MAG: chemotaxis protein CheW [Bryobacterales bacterium]|nr:chemotaxis protein CheW [Bryobacterales bacterium]